ncbi:MAG: SAM-dependent methyltransferase, partial [Salinimicrobium sediminis]|nr:SAM-dependent methyltransferase [Salinimicrobium sediminis]
IIGPYWATERRYLQDGYKTIPFPFKEIETPPFSMKHTWSFERLLGYLNTWSAVKAFEKEKGENPVELIKNDLFNSFGELGSVEFPILLRVGRNPE